MLDWRRLSDVSLYGECAHTGGTRNSGGGFGLTCGAPVVDHHVATALGEGERNRLADAAGAAGDDGDGAVQVSHGEAVPIQCPFYQRARRGERASRASSRTVWESLRELFPRKSTVS